MKKLIVANWKMNPPSISEAKRIANEIKRNLRTVKKSQVVLCPPFVYFSELSNFSGGHFFLGAQDAFYESLGHYTGEVSYSQLQDFKIDFVILGHSERRAMGESDEIINKKVQSVIGSQMKAILCVGEKERDHHGEYLHFVKKQIMDGLKNVSKKSLNQIVIAYEPVFAIGTRQAIRPQDIFEMAIYIRKILHDMFGVYGDDARILYGGSVMTNDADTIVRDGNVSGLLIGRESLRSKDFIQIVKLVDAI